MAQPETGQKDTLMIAVVPSAIQSGWMTRFNGAQHLDTMPNQMLLPATHVKHGMPLEDISFLICSSVAGSTPALGVYVRTVIVS